MSTPAIIRKPWGREYLCFRNEHVGIWALHITAGARTSMHAHPKKNTALVVLSGAVELSFIRGEPRRMVGLDKINIFRGRFHRTRAISDAVLLEVEAPDDKRDIVRLDDDYGRAALPLEEPTEARDESCLQIDWRPVVFAGCALQVLDPLPDPASFSEMYGHVFITLQGGLARGLVPAGDAIDGATLSRLASQFPPLPGSQFLRIRRSSTNDEGRLIRRT